MNRAIPSMRKCGRMGFACLVAAACFLSSSVFAADSSVPTAAAASYGSLLQVMFGLGLVLAAIAGTAWLLRRFSPGQVSANGSLRVVSAVMVGPKERVVLVDVGDTRLVLGVAPGQIRTLHQMERPADESGYDASVLPNNVFYSRLREMLNKQKGRNAP